MRCEEWGDDNHRDESGVMITTEMREVSGGEWDDDDNHRDERGKQRGREWGESPSVQL